MSKNPASPLLGDNDSESDTRVGRPASHRSNRSKRSKASVRSTNSDESTPLLSRSDESGYGNEPATNNGASSPDAASLISANEGDNAKKRSRFRTPTIIALSTLIVLVVVILGLGFAAPAVVEEYAMQAALFEPTDLSIDSFTTNGIKARIQGKFSLDGSRVERKPVRDLGRFSTWIARAIETRPSKVEVYLPDQDNILLGTADVAPIVVSIRDGDVTNLDFTADLEPGDDNGMRGIKRVANDWIKGDLEQLKVMGKAHVSLKSGIFPLGTQTISKSIVFKGHDIPTIPQYDITRFNVHEVELSDTERGMAADVSITAFNKFPVTFEVPPLGFDILVPGCTPNVPSLLLANATTNIIEIKPNQPVTVDVEGVIRQISKTLITECPDTHNSPLDTILANYMNGEKTTFFVRGAKSPIGNTPAWVTDLINGVVVPIPFTGHSFDNLIKNFSMTDVHFGMPNPFADPDSPDAQPKISATIKVTANLPKEMNFPVDVTRVRARSDVFYEGRKLGVLDLHKWQKSQSKKIEADGDGPPGIVVTSIVKDAPLEITDNDVFQELVQKLLFGAKGVILDVKANVDVETLTALGQFVVRDIPAEGKVPVKTLSGHGAKSFDLKIESLKLLDTSPSSVLLKLTVNITNPTEYSATVPYVDIHVLNNGTLFGHATAQNISVVPGRNDGIVVQVVWDPKNMSGTIGAAKGREFISQYISGYNTTLTLRTHNGTIPSIPRLGAALSAFAAEIPTPRITTPKSPNHPDDTPEGDDKPRFIDDATMHLFTSTATFTLLSPLSYSTIYITHLNATAFYNHTEPVGEIIYDLPFAVPPGATTSPRLPVDWSLGSVGYAAVKDALGGTLKLDARATVGVRVGAWQERVWYQGRGIGAHVEI